MKEKKENRYFYEGVKKSDKIIVIIIVLSLFLIVGGGTFVVYNHTIKHYNNEISSYSESDYIYLDELAEDIIKENVGIDFTSLPNEVKYKCTKEDDRITIELSLDNKERKISEGAILNLELSEDLNLISKNRNYSSEKHFVKYVKSNIIIMSILTSCFIWIVLFAWSYLIIGMPIEVSNMNKYKDKKDI